MILLFYSAYKGKKDQATSPKSEKEDRNLLSNNSRHRRDFTS